MNDDAPFSDLHFPTTGATNPPPRARSCNSGSTILRLNPFLKHSTFLIQSTGFPDLKIMAKKKAIDGVSDQMNAIAFQNLDHARAGRRVRLAFTQVQQQLDHVLFKMAPSGIRTEEVIYLVQSDHIDKGHEV
ncbi:hypothetical protein E3N88_37652 [Mikania micrantha]|uniref:Uncharacterized protein n=1 Tax=Mikania micrantha TaxID=192012 RepID=A0A5N6LSQ6_9ASTR|nr:hypothetical protein E3N88_37652 [Mikania micrantha]